MILQVTDPILLRNMLRAIETQNTKYGNLWDTMTHYVTFKHDKIAT